MNREQEIHIFVVDDEPIGADDISEMIYQRFHDEKHPLL